jgi:hypothetical protein
MNYWADRTPLKFEQEDQTLQCDGVRSRTDREAIGAYVLYGVVGR